MDNFELYSGSCGLLFYPTCIMKDSVIFLAAVYTYYRSLNQEERR